jgi:hypothetical protein
MHEQALLSMAHLVGEGAVLEAGGDQLLLQGQARHHRLLVRRRRRLDLKHDASQDQGREWSACDSRHKATHDQGTDRSAHHLDRMMQD